MHRASQKSCIAIRSSKRAGTPFKTPLSTTTQLQKENRTRRNDRCTKTRGLEVGSTTTPQRPKRYYPRTTLLRTRRSQNHRSDPLRIRPGGDRFSYFGRHLSPNTNAQRCGVYTYLIRDLRRELYQPVLRSPMVLAEDIGRFVIRRNDGIWHVSIGDRNDRRLLDVLQAIPWHHRPESFARQYRFELRRRSFEHRGVPFPPIIQEYLRLLDVPLWAITKTPHARTFPWGNGVTFP